MQFLFPSKLQYIYIVFSSKFPINVIVDFTDHLDVLLFAIFFEYFHVVFLNFRIPLYF